MPCSLAALLSIEPAHHQINPIEDGGLSGWEHFRLLISHSIFHATSRKLGAFVASKWANHSTNKFIVCHICPRQRIVQATVQKGTVWLPSRCHDVSMPHKNRKTQPDDATRASVTKEMAKPRMARSAKIAELNLDTSRIREQPSTTMPGTVDKIIPSLGSSQPEKAQIAVDSADHRYRALRIENTLIDEHGDDVRLRKGANVDVTVTAKAGDRN